VQQSLHACCAYFGEGSLLSHVAEVIYIMQRSRGLDLICTGGEVMCTDMCTGGALDHIHRGGSARKWRGVRPKAYWGRSWNILGTSGEVL